MKSIKEASKDVLKIAIAKSGLNPLMNPIIIRYENFKMLLQKYIVLYKIVHFKRKTN